MGMRHLLELHGVEAPQFLAALEEDLGREEVATVSIGIGITTHNRPEVLAKTLAKIRQYTPGARIVVVDDASTPPVVLDGDTAIYHFAENVGVARAKNMCLSLLDDCEHIFLFDDDAFPIREDWWRPYVESPEPHLMRIFPDLLGPTKLNDIKEVYRGDGHVAYTRPRGVMLYAHRSVLDIVGGMDPGFGKWGYEHGDWSNRIFAAGLTTWRFADVIDSDKLVYSLDEHVEVNRTMPNHRERQEAVKKNLPRYRAQANSPIRYEYRESRNVVLTCLFATKDPQRPRAAPLTLAAIRPLEESVKAAGISGHDFVVFANTVEDQGWAGVELVELGLGNLYIQRWVTFWRWLRDHPEVGMAWCVDGTDVELLRDPFQLEPGRLYIGVETTFTGSGWLGRNSHPAIQELIGRRNMPLLNAGLVGGDRATVMGFLHDIIRGYFDNQAEMFETRGTVDITEHVNDMGLLNVVARSEKWWDRLHYGGDVNTVFKADERTPYAMWKHK